MFAIALTTGGDAPINAVGNKLIAIAQGKTTYYASHGSAGLLAAFTKGHVVQLDGQSRRRRGLHVDVVVRKICRDLGSDAVVFSQGLNMPWSTCF